MVNQMPAKFTFQLGPLVTPELAAEIRALSYATGDSMSIVARRLIEEGLRVVARRKGSAAWPEPDERQCAAAVAYVREYESRQLERRRANNRDRHAAARGTAPAETP